MWFFLLWRHGRPRMTNDQQLIILVTQCTIVLIRKNIGSIKFVSGEAAEHNCPNTEEYRVNKIHIGRCSRARYEFYWPDIFCIGTIVHCVTNLSWFCNQTSYLMFSILGQWIYHDFESIQPCILLTLSHLSVFHGIWNLPWFCLHISPLTPFFSY